MKSKVVIVIVISIALNAFVVRRELAYPSAWDKIQLGMSRQEVYALTGPGGGEWPGWKGPFWRDSGIIIWHEMEVEFVRDRVTYIHINRYAGAHHPLGTLRHESARDRLTELLADQ